MHTKCFSHPWQSLSKWILGLKVLQSLCGSHRVMSENIEPRARRSKRGHWHDSNSCWSLRTIALHNLIMNNAASTDSGRRHPLEGDHIQARIVLANVILRNPWTSFSGRIFLCSPLLPLKHGMVGPVQGPSNALIPPHRKKCLGKMIQRISTQWHEHLHDILSLLFYCIFTQ